MLKKPDAEKIIHFTPLQRVELMFVDKILMTPKFQQMAAKQHSVAA
jgi:hypothetical protein